MLEKVLTSQEKQAIQVARYEALKIDRALRAFSEECHAHALTPDGQERAQFLADRAYDEAIAHHNFVREYMEMEEVA